MTEAAAAVSPMHPRNAQEAICRAPGCGKPFTPRKSWQRFCSADCRRAFHKGAGVDPRRLEALERRLAAVEAVAHPPVDWTDLERRISELERKVRDLRLETR